MTFELPAETQDREVTITIPAAVDEYFKEWFLETKKDSETPEAFAYRNLAKAGLAYRVQKVQLEQVATVKELINSIKLDADTVALDNNL